MKHVKLYEEFEAYNEFEIDDPNNVAVAKRVLDQHKIEYDITDSKETTFFIFSTSEDLEKATELVSEVIDKTKESEWE